MRNSKGKEGILLQSTKAIVRRDLTGRSTMRWGTYLKRYGTLYLLLLVPLAFFIIFRYVPMSYILLAFKKNNILAQVQPIFIHYEKRRLGMVHQGIQR